MNEERVALDCPYCRMEIYRPLNWFRQAYFTCPACGGGLSASQFAPMVEALDEAADQCIDEMIAGKPGCGGHSTCPH